MSTEDKTENKGFGHVFLYISCQFNILWNLCRTVVKSLGLVMLKFLVEKVEKAAWDSTGAHRQVDTAGPSQISEL